MKLKTTVTLSAALLALGVTSAAQAGTLEDVQGRGVLRCVTSTGIAGFAQPDANGVWRGFDVDFCRATAAAVLGDANKIEAVTSTGKTRFTKLNAGEGDVLWRNTTITFTRDVGVKLRFHGVNYYDGQGFMVRKDLGVNSAMELDGASVCIQTGTTTELNLSDYFNTNGMKYEPVTIETNDEGRQNYESGRCDVYTTDASGLASTRSALPDPDAHVVLPEIISKEPLGPATRHGDDQWSDIVTWVLNATITAEELGVTSQNVDAMKDSKNPEVRRLLGTDGSQGEELGLSNDWAYQIIKQVGNYGEIFENNIGVNTPLGIARGLNALWTNGGLLYSPPFR
ncbi:MAG: amino acid ABC transporter substrate-binding protein [Arenicellales bacterium]|jgi:general L-amino acid transport system substrate-binding protein|nr:amino acid ABC transporter substrate-binding protein [Acidiferrobacteraceae bacterium]MDP6122348.1 amino acid ABC transporter substrate-binding protein [Arenicellales bacterium]MBT59772.1 amino acid ABC transporter substrate-binding protein [Acidiferrobacteraceae bacterium]MDP6289917.1 amino acid ABC transporter substrate-binding protein [Arenicellales bacterium]MDP6434705.1 amino acid ABC transporter substrate-binding protein [Arenicellales bacterium]|tara:strand:- start:10022 stop:11041 length:1020 start_codon:yes stop_codon:yes gene_type:complete